MASDWLRDIEPALPARDNIDEPTPSESDSDVPAWLRDLQSSVSQEPEAENDQVEEAEHAPNWLADLRLTTPAKLEPDAPEGEATGAEIPDWLAELRPEVAEGLEPIATASETEQVEDAVPDWLAELQPSAEEPDFGIDTPEEEAIEADIPGWLAELQPEAEEAEFGIDTPEEEAVETDRPDWLAELQPDAKEPEFGIEAPEEEGIETELPDWLAELQPDAEEPEFGIEALEEEVIEAGVPDWLAELRPVSSEEPESLLPAEEAEAEAPEWLTELWPGTSEELEPTPPAPEDEEVEAEAPEWLTELWPGTSEELEPAPPVPEAEEVEATIDEWLAELRPVTSEEVEPGLPTPEAEEVETEASDWLAQFRQSILEEPEPESAPLESDTGVKDTPEGAGVPTWIADLGVKAPSKAPEPAEGDLEEAELPDWLVPAHRDPEEEGLERAEIPDWLLSLKPRELRAEFEEQVEDLRLDLDEVQDTGLLAGIENTLPIEMLIAQPRSAIAAGPEELASDSPAARIFSEIVGKPPSIAPKVVAQPKKHLLAEMPRWIIYIALVAAISLPLLIGQPLLSQALEPFLPRSLEPFPAVEDLYKEIESLDSGSLVLVAFDYDPSTSGEMEVPAQAIVDHLMERGASIVTVSLLPAGPPTAQKLLEKAANGYPEYVYGEHYVNLGYVPGQAAGARLVSQSLGNALPRDFAGNSIADLELMEQVENIQDVDLLVELAADQDTVRWWIEQAGTPYAIPVGAAVSASAEALIRPYYETEPKQLKGLVGGVPGAAMYETLLGGSDDLADSLAARLDSQLAGHLVLILVLLVGNGVHLVQRRTRRER